MDCLKDIDNKCTIAQHGYVELLDCMPRLIADNETIETRIANAARVSTSLCQPKRKANQKQLDAWLIRRLYRDNHMSPFEMIEFTFAIQLPIFVMRQLVRHRTASLNEYSGRYSVMQPLFYVPDTLKAQHATNKQMSGDTITDDETINLFTTLMNGCDIQYEIYNELVAAGLSKEIARMGLSVNMYTRIYWKVNLRNLLHFCNLRMAGDAQAEIREYANTIYSIVSTLCPITCNAYEDFTSNALRLSSNEAKALSLLLKNTTSSDIETAAQIISNKTERQEFIAKITNLV